MIRRAVKKIKYFGWNLRTALYVFFRKREADIVLAGAWMGTKFADNSRFLFQYLNDNKEKLGLQKVIWVTRDETVNRKLRDHGYESYLCGTRESDYWHKTAGIHIICNAIYPQNHFEPDIDTHLSWGAKKINLWHGVGLKCTGKTANNYGKKIHAGEEKSFFKKTIKKLISSGGWESESYHLCTSPFMLEVNKRNFEYDEKLFFYSQYPRNCNCLRYMPEEVKVIEDLKKFQGIVIYLPTFRDQGKEYFHPLQDGEICSFLRENHYVWVDKPHPAETEFFSGKTDACHRYILPAEFDINILYENCTVMISDYSSAVFDGILKDIPVIAYVPDLAEYKKGNNGLMMDFEQCLAGLTTRNTKGVLNMLEEVKSRCYFDGCRKKTYEDNKERFWDNRRPDYQEIWETIAKLGHA